MIVDLDFSAMTSNDRIEALKILRQAQELLSHDAKSDDERVMSKNEPTRADRTQLKHER